MRNKKKERLIRNKNKVKLFITAQMYKLQAYSLSIREGLFTVVDIYL